MIIAFGSNGVDIYFATDKLPEEGGIVYADNYTQSAGGRALNQAVAARRAGSRVRYFGCVGRDIFGQYIKDFLRSEGIDPADLHEVDTPTSFKAIMHKSGQATTIASKGANNNAQAAQISDAILTPDTIILLPNSARLKETESLIQRAHSKGVRVVLNYAPTTPIIDDSVLAKVFLVVLNLKEAATILARFKHSSIDPVTDCLFLSQKWNNTVIITMGGDGAVLSDAKNNQILTIPAYPKIDVVDAVGAGDTFLGNFTASLDQGHSLTECLMRATIAGALACTKVGATAGMPTLEEVSKYTPTAPRPSPLLRKATG